ncbi:MAG TPA: NADPH-dependent 7-cyano-7-deazaguanine reductase QueF [Deltaproteobacteria bacterium]|nr:NADPH-dependent 7-cyano-7-deazaguanine reductase QueF [Deltaproteobacteria bacterium]
MKYGEQAVEKAELERWKNNITDHDYVVTMEFPEFTCLCPRSGYPDFATIKVEYIPDEYVIELKSFKLYLNRYRSRHISHEDATNQIYDDLKKILKPKFIQVIGDFASRGNLKTTIRVSSRINESTPMENRRTGKNN